MSSGKGTSSVLARASHRSKEELARRDESDPGAAAFIEYCQGLFNDDAEIQRKIRERVVFELDSRDNTRPGVVVQLMRIAAEGKKSAGGHSGGARHVHFHMNDWTPEQLKRFAETGMRPGQEGESK